MKHREPKPRTSAFAGACFAFLLCSLALNYSLLTQRLLNPNALTIQIAQDDAQRAFSEPVTLSRQ